MTPRLVLLAALALSAAAGCGSDSGSRTATTPPTERVPGESKAAPDGCNTCTCSADGHWGCTGMTCQASCEPQDIEPAGQCEIDFFGGWKWNGQDCFHVAACACGGQDCDEAHESEGQCLAAHESCVPSCEPPDVQLEGEGCDFPIHLIVWDGQQCVSLVGCQCTGAGCTQGYASLTQCEAKHAPCGALP